MILDGDAVRTALRAQRYATEDRDAFYRTLAALAGLVARQDIVALVSATAPKRAHRDGARVCGAPFVEVWVDTPLEVCEARDSKGLYAAARRGEITTLPGAQVPYEAPACPDVVAHGGLDELAIDRIVARVLVERTELAELKERAS